MRWMNYYGFAFVYQCHLRSTIAQAKCVFFCKNMCLAHLTHCTASVNGVWAWVICSHQTCCCQVILKLMICTYYILQLYITPPQCTQESKRKSIWNIRTQRSSEAERKRWISWRKHKVGLFGVMISRMWERQIQLKSTCFSRAEWNRCSIRNKVRIHNNNRWLVCSGCCVYENEMWLFDWILFPSMHKLFSSTTNLSISTEKCNQNKFALNQTEPHTKRRRRWWCRRRWSVVAAATTQRKIVSCCFARFRLHGNS